MDDETEQVELDAQLVQRIRDRTELSDFNSVREYVEFTMESVLAEVEEREEETDGTAETDVQERLESLGYVED